MNLVDLPWLLRIGRGPIAMVAVFAVAACSGNNAPCYGISVGDHISVTVVDTYDVNSTFEWQGPVLAGRTCGFGFDLKQNQVLTATVNASFDGDYAGCRVGEPDFASPDGWVWSRSDLTVPPPFGGTLLFGNYTATSATCSGLLTLDFTVNSGDPFQPSVSGERPHVLLYRNFAGNGTPDCASCAGTFVVNVQKQ